MKRYEVWARFEDGIEAKVETHVKIRHAQSAIDAMNIQNQHDIAEGYGFTHGVPTYYIIEREIQK